MTYQTGNIRIVNTQEVLTPEELTSEFQVNEKAAKTVFEARETVHKMLHGSDDRLLAIVGPCSIHDTKAAHEYAEKLKVLRTELIDDVYIIMRVYFEKPRTTVGWKGLINDPNLDNSFEINKGLKLARGLLLELAEQGMPSGTEYLDLITPQYLSDLVSWGAIGARTTESQGHRELASGLSCPVGFKNGTSGNMQIAVDAIRAASCPHEFLGVTNLGRSAIFQTRGNDDCHIILRGGRQPNYDAASVDDASAMLEKAGLPTRIMIDVSHANSRKIYERQIDVSRDIAQQLSRGDGRIFGVMIESHLTAGRQDVKPGETLTYGQSITDPCLDFESTADVLRELATAIQKRRTQSS